MGNFQDAKGNNNYGNDDAESPLLPPIENMRDIAIHVAIKVALQAQQDGVAPEMSEQKVSDQVQKRFWIPEYRNYKSQRSKISNQRINNQQYRGLA